MSAMRELVVRPARSEEYAVVGELTLAAYTADGYVPASSGYGAALLDAHSRAVGAELLVAVDSNDRPMGTVTVCPPGSPFAEIAKADELEFRMLAVPPAARGRGVGAQLVETVLARARELGLSRVVMCSATGMATAHRLYARTGFRRLPDRDWQPVPEVELWAFEREV